MFKATLTLDPEDLEYCAPYDIDYHFAGDWVLCGGGLTYFFDFELSNLPEKITLLVRKDKPKKKKGWFKALFLCEENSEIIFYRGEVARESETTPVYRDLISWVSYELDLKEGDKFWVSIEY